MLPAGMGDQLRYEPMSRDEEIATSPTSRRVCVGRWHQWGALLLGMLLIAAAVGASIRHRNATAEVGFESPNGEMSDLWSFPGMMQGITSGVCDTAAKVFQHQLCMTTTTTTTTITSTGSTTTTTTSSSTTSTATTTSTTVTFTSTTTTTTTTTSTTEPVLWPYPADWKGKEILKGISYAPVPLKHPGAVLPDDDFMADGTSPFWGRHGKGRKDVGGGDIGRRDLSIMRALGANAVRLYGNDPALDHTAFLDEARAQGLDVIAGFSDYPYVQMKGNCMKTQWDCYKVVKEQYLKNLKNGYLSGPKTYHPALRTVILMNEPDLKFEGGLQGFPGWPRHFCKALISAFDGVLDAEREVGVEGLAPNFTATFSFGRCHKCSKHVDLPSLGQMMELRNAMQTPESVGYKPRNDLWTIYKRRFVNSFNTANPAGEMRDLFLDTYDAEFQGTPVFIGEYHSPHLINQQMDLKGIINLAADPSTLLTGISFFEFQVRYDKGGGEMSFGMFGLSDDYDIADAHISTRTYTSWCLTPMVLRSTEQCGQTETDTDYMTTGPWSQHLDHIPTADMCCTKCQEAPDCQAWTWVKDAGLDGCPSQCWLKGGTPTNKLPKTGVVSGLPRRTKRKQYVYLHVEVAKAFGGRGVEPEQLCPVTTTTSTLTTSTSTRSSTTTTTKTMISTTATTITTSTLTTTSNTKSTTSASTHSLLSMSWVGCYMHAGQDVAKKSTVVRQHIHKTTACAKECHSHKYILLRNNKHCSCMDQHPTKAKFERVDDDKCGNVCADEVGLHPTRYCGAASVFAIYNIEPGSVDDLLMKNAHKSKGNSDARFLGVTLQ